MNTRGYVPPTSGLPPTLAPATLPALSAAQNFVTDHILRPNHEIDNHTNPNPLFMNAPGHGMAPVPHGSLPALHGSGSTLHGMGPGLHGNSTVLRNDPHRSFTDESALTKQIRATHLEGFEDYNVKPILAIVEDIMRLGKPLPAENVVSGTHIPASQLETLENKLFHSSLQGDKALQQYPHQGDKALHSSHQGDKALLYPHQGEKVFYNSLHDGYEHDTEIVKYLAFPINKISNEIVCKCSAGAESHSVTMDLLQSLANYSWDAKVVITFAAFAINYGEFWLVENLHTKNPLAKNIAILKDLPEILEHAGDLRKQFEAVLDLLNAALKVTHSIIAFKELPSQYISHESPELLAATNYIPIAVYWIIKSLLACASTLLNLIGRGHEYITSTAESWEILNLAHKLSVISDHLQKQLLDCKDSIDKKRAEDDYAKFKELMSQTHIDNMKKLKAMIRFREDQKPLWDGTKGTLERLEALRLKYVLLLITDLDIPHEELNVLHMIYNQQAMPMRHQYEVLWLPIAHRTTSSLTGPDKTFTELLKYMPWYSVEHPSMVEPVCARYAREFWNFDHMPMVVVMDPQGRISKNDALPMMWIWGSDGFPFTREHEIAQWARHEYWNMELILVDAIEPLVKDWVRDNKVICLYGGDDIDWIRKFTLSARAMATALHVPLEMLYVGKRNPRGRVKSCHEAIHRENLSHTFPVAEYYDYVWYFWVRLWSMWNSKKQLGMTVDNDRIMPEIMDVLTFDSSEQGWAVFGRGKYEMTKGMGDAMVHVMEDYQNWGHRVDHPDKFIPVLDEEIHGFHPEHHCKKLIFPSYTGYIPERVVCSECGQTMDKFVMYRCCTD